MGCLGTPDEIAKAVALPCVERQQLRHRYRTVRRRRHRTDLMLSIRLSNKIDFGPVTNTELYETLFRR